MLSLLLVASFVLPSVLGNCCLPDTISATILEAGNSNPSHVLVDFSSKKFIYKPYDHSVVDFVLNDINKGKVYTMLHSGVCSIHDMPLSSSTYDQCLHGAHLAGSSYLGPFGGMLVDSYIIEHDDAQSIMSVTSDACMPVVSITSLPNGDLTTHFWANVTTTADVSGLNVDVDNCVEEEEV